MKNANAILPILAMLVHAAFTQEPDASFTMMPWEAAPDAVPQADAPFATILEPDATPQVVAPAPEQYFEAAPADAPFTTIFKPFAEEPAPVPAQPQADSPFTTIDEPYQVVEEQYQEVPEVAPAPVPQVVAPVPAPQVIVPDTVRQIIAPDTVYHVVVPYPQQAQQQQTAPPQEPQKQEPPKESLPMHTITVDFGPTIIGALIGKAGELVSQLNTVQTTGFGIAAKYEWQPFRFISAAARVAYLGGGVGYTDIYEGGRVTADVNLSATSFEFHPRLYPFGGGFFLDWMMGYASMSTDLKGELVVNVGGMKVPVPAEFSVSRNYRKMGGQIGWRVDFGKPGGFIFEHSYGWYVARGMGSEMGKQISDKIVDQGLLRTFLRDLDGIVEIPKLDDAFFIFEDFIFIGGPRIEFAFGWRF